MDIICLRLSQYFQLISHSNLCNIDSNQNIFRMVLRDKYDELRLDGVDQAYTIRYSKQKALNTVMSGAFKYMLYNSHSQKFEFKVSKESRMFVPTSINNLDEVCHNFSLAKKNCIKLSGFSFLIFHKPDESFKKEDEDHEI